MPIRTKKYESRGGRRIRAVKVTEKNYVELLDWVIRNSQFIFPDTSVSAVTVSKNGTESNHRLRLHIEGKGIRVAHVGDYIAHILDEVTGKPLPEVFIVKSDVITKYSAV